MINVYKLTNGEDLMGNVVEQSEEGMFIQNPVSYTTLPNHGFQMKDWTLLVKEDTIFLNMKHIMVDLGEPNEFGAYCYESFIKHRKMQKDFLEESTDSLMNTETADLKERTRMDLEELSDDVREIFENLVVTDKRQIN